MKEGETDKEEKKEEDKKDEKKSKDPPKPEPMVLDPPKVPPVLILISASHSQFFVRGNFAVRDDVDSCACVGRFCR